MKKILVFVLIVMMCIGLIVYVSYANNKNYEANVNLTAVRGYKNLYYDNKTQIVYFIYNEAHGYKLPYYAPNGLPYKYDVDNHALIEINHISD